MADKEAAAAVKAMRERISAQAMEIIDGYMPAKVAFFDAVFRDIPPMSAADVEATVASLTFPAAAAAGDAAAAAPAGKRKRGADAEAPAGKRRVDADGLEEAPKVPCNQRIVELVDKIRPELVESVERLNTVKMWVQLNVPKMGAGDNFGVDVQEAIIQELARAEETGFSVLENLTKYFVMRAKLVSRLIKYPTLDDLRQSVVELDGKEFQNLRLSCLDIRNNFLVLNDMVNKNRERLTKPRGEHDPQRLY